MKNDDGALSFGTSVDLRGLETGISQIEAKIATMEGKLGAKIDGIGKAVSRSGITAKSTLEDVTNAGNVLDGTGTTPTIPSCGNLGDTEVCGWSFRSATGSTEMPKRAYRPCKRYEIRKKF